MLPLQTYMVVNTDLDATLLDHHSYTWEPAQEALNALKERGIPLILNSSKTLAEMEELARDLGLNEPLVCENGSFIAIPQEGSFPLELLEEEFTSVEESGAYWLCHLGVSRKSFLDTLSQIRNEREHYLFEGYADWDVATIAHHTGLPVEKAPLSGQRNGTEPIHWHGTEESFAAFEAELSQHKLKAVSGGRFIHISGLTDKAMGLERVSALYQKIQPDATIKTVALGDSPNDLGMLNQADIAVVIPNKKRLEPTAPTVIQAEEEGPTGWNTAILSILAKH